MPNRSWVIGAVVLLSACGQEDATVRPAGINRKPEYFDVKALLDEQVARLNRQQPVVQKQVQLRNGRIETSQVANTDWSKELQIFYQADINKPALRGAYSIANSASNDSVGGARTYTLKAGSEAPVASLAVSKTGEASDATQEVAALIRQDNPLFFSQKRLRLRTVDGTLTSYSVQGVQKLVFFDTVRYSVQVRVVK
ncbi:hypothetical protein [Hymenobacter psychrotolerans]|uniref:Uncharacterized protein n=1 Tax=Hymenobacter psychrotolerans DSM 18569 TaxID=1121959 RepID=A0A1M7CB15_9BACT|nr:hypothetical protein [Hymenobacter psychrotolerans]SHL64363.1 hypothetical protein SAMN02746009_03113 [Hymenobacter psychrotolerans DSM 18569]